MENPDAPIEPPHLRFLRRLVTILTVTMILGVITIIVLLVIRLQTPVVDFQSDIALPATARAVAVTRHADWVAVVTEDNQILIFSADGQTLRQSFTID